MKALEVYVYECRECDLLFGVPVQVREEDVFCPKCCKSSELSLDREDGLLIHDDSIFGA